MNCTISASLLRVSHHLQVGSQHCRLAAGAVQTFRRSPGDCQGPKWIDFNRVHHEKIIKNHPESLTILNGHRLGKWMVKGHRADSLIDQICFDLIY